MPGGWIPQTAQRLEGYHSETVPVLDHYNPKGIVTKSSTRTVITK